MGPNWGWQDHVGPMNLAIREDIGKNIIFQINTTICFSKALVFTVMMPGDSHMVMWDPLINGWGNDLEMTLVIEWHHMVI